MSRCHHQWSGTSPSRALSVRDHRGFSDTQLCHRLSWGHQRSAIEFWKTIWSLLICSVLIERIEITYQRGIPDTSFTCLHLTGITSTARKTNGIPIWHSVKKNDVKIATIGWQLHCVQADNSNKAPTIMKFHASIWQKNLFCLTGNVLTPKILCSHICRWIHSVYKAKSAVREIS